MKSKDKQNLAMVIKKPEKTVKGIIGQRYERTFQGNDLGDIYMCIFIC